MTLMRVLHYLTTLKKEKLCFKPYFILCVNTFLCELEDFLEGDFGVTGLGVCAFKDCCCCSCICCCWATSNFCCCSATAAWEVSCAAGWTLVAGATTGVVVAGATLAWGKLIWWAWVCCCRAWMVAWMLTGWGTWDCWPAMWIII